MMIELHALSLAPAALDWLRYAIEPRVLHVFDRVCNLVDSRGEVLSIVARSIGNGPFSIVVPIDRAFAEFITADSEIETRNWELVIGSISIAATDAGLWSPQPRWNEARHTGVFPSEEWERGISIAVDDKSFFSGRVRITDDLMQAVADNDIETCRCLSRQLAGLGVGLTPSGDDFLMGIMYAVWSIKPLAEAKMLTQAMADEAAPLTTSLSAAWLRAASRGEANADWHALIDALIDRDRDRWQSAIDRILNTGYTSGTEALSGFFSAAQSMLETPAAALRSTF